MERHLLITSSDDTSALYAVRFVASFFNKRDLIRLTIFNVASPGSSGSRTSSGAARGAAPPSGNEAIESSRRILRDAGFPETNIEIRQVRKKAGTVKDIIHEARQGLYDAVVLGRRGYTLFEQTLDTSTTRSILDQEIDFPVWICKRPQESRKNVLLCVDDSEPSMRMADHIGFILENEEDQKITILHVNEGKNQAINDILDRAKQMLLQNHIPAGRILTQVISSSNPAKTIQEEAGRGHYAVVAVGRGSKQPTGIRKWISGSISTRLLENIEEAVLWVSK